MPPEVHRTVHFIMFSVWEVSKSLTAQKCVRLCTILGLSSCWDLRPNARVFDFQPFKISLLSNSSASYRTPQPFKMKAVPETMRINPLNTELNPLCQQYK